MPSLPHIWVNANVPRHVPSADIVHAPVHQSAFFGEAIAAIDATRVNGRLPGGAAVYLRSYRNPGRVVCARTSSLQRERPGDVRGTVGAVGSDTLNFGVFRMDGQPLRVGTYTAGQPRNGEELMAMAYFAKYGQITLPHGGTVTIHELQRDAAGKVERLVLEFSDYARARTPYETRDIVLVYEA